MKARIAIQIGVSPHEARVLAKAAAVRGIALATWVRQAALLMAKTNPQLATVPVVELTTTRTSG